MSPGLCCAVQVAERALFFLWNDEVCVVGPGLCCVVQVAERALFLWNNDYIVGLVAHNRATILPILFGPLERNARSHWNQVGHCRVLLVGAV